MKAIMRAINCIKGNKEKYGLICLLYIAVFTITISTMILYSSYAQQLKVLEKGLGSCVTLRIIQAFDKATNTGGSTDMRREDAEIFTDSRFVECNW